jgi:hypothetical protein
MVQTQPYGGAPAQPAASQDPWDLVEGGGGIPAVKFGSRDAYGRFIPADVGTSYTGILTEDLVKTQVIDFDSKEPKFWKNGDPVMQVVATVQTDLREDDEDNGLRRIFFKSGALTAFQTEVREKKIGRFGPGTRITITLIGFKPNKDPNMNPANVFDVTIGPEIVAWVPAEQRAVDNVVGFAQHGTPAAVQQQVQAAQASGFPTAAQQAVLQAPQYVEPAQPAFAGQVVPAEQALPLVTQEDVTGVGTLTAIGIPRDQAISQIAAAKGLGADFIAALQQAVPAQQ